MVSITLLPEKKVGELEIEICPFDKPDGTTAVAIRIFSADNAMAYNGQFSLQAPYTVKQLHDDLQQLTQNLNPMSATRANVVVHRFILANSDKIYQYF